MKKVTLLLGLISLAFGLTACRPEIAVVLDDYCHHQEACGFANINKETQYHDYKSCDKFHRDMLDNAASGGASGCRGDVEQFFIDYMHAHMNLGCDGTLVEALNSDQASQEQLETMLMCVKENSKSENVNGDLAELGISILSTLEIDITALKPELMRLIMEAVIGTDTETEK